MSVLDSDFIYDMLLYKLKWFLVHGFSSIVHRFSNNEYRTTDNEKRISDNEHRCSRDKFYSFQM
jgi:hypothetical protein